MTDYQAALNGATEALHLCIAGEHRAGLDLYARHAQRPIAGRLPLGLHAHLIEEAGHGATALELRTMALRRGGDVSWRALSKSGGAPEIAAEEYEGWFARGFGNPCMIDRYIRALTRLGRADELEALFDVARLFRRVDLPDPESVERVLLAMEDALPYGSKQVTHHTAYAMYIERRGDPALDRLVGQLHDTLDGYFAEWAASDHPFAHLVPRQFSVTGWALLSREDGYNGRHIHPLGWATGVYYPAGLPAGSTGGQLRVGGWEDPAPPGFPDMTITPEAGMLLIFPSWYVHWTEPTQVAEPRLSIAFDALPTGDE